MSGTKGECSLPTFGITYKSLTYDVGTVDRQVQLIDVWHNNAYLLVPRLVYHPSTKLKNDAIHNRIGQTDKVKLIHFLTRYRYATRAASFCKLRGAYGKTQTCRIWTTSIIATIGIESFQWQWSWSCFSMHASCINPRWIQISLSQHWMDLIMQKLDQWDLYGHTE